MITQVPFSFIYPANTEKVLSMCCNSLNKYLCVWPSKLEIRRKMKDFFLFIYCALCSSSGRHWLFLFFEGWVAECLCDMRFLLCCFSEDLNMSSFGRITGNILEKTFWVSQNIPFQECCFCFLSLGTSSWVKSHPWSGPALPCSFLSSSGATPMPMPSSFCFWGTVEPGWSPSAFRSRSDGSGICYIRRRYHWELHYFPGWFFYVLQNFQFFCFCFFLLFSPFFWGGL